ncbi:hypothetical protein FAZ15_21855 [Sphingobacterium olei]|uniref:Redoxin domain-containing protein n=1 Tax=Sphingobacterium olei TaxID=2571155 RepID=A0A4U0NJH3_9SPHI|nr:hypothetical protein [Sphingobacterium olei]TJZ50064.1 hypothetical protein FAZ15_21855 [Sphingobacterium olei]
MKIFKNIVIVVFVLINSATTLKASDSIPRLVLGVGDRMPSQDMGQLMNGSRLPAAVGLSQRLVILDFMNTSCTSCLASLEKLRKLQNNFGDSLKIVLVTPETGERVSNFSARNDVITRSGLDVVVNDSLLFSLFPHRTVPHTAWILDGVVQAISFTEFVDSAHVADLLKAGEIDLPTKADFLQYNDAIPLQTNMLYQSKLPNSTFEGHLSFSNTKFGRYIDSTNRLVREYMINTPIVPAYLYVYGKIEKLPYMKPHRIVIESVAKEKFDFRHSVEKYEEIWKRKYSISYEALFSQETGLDEKMRWIINDLDSKVKLRSALEDRFVRCWIITEGRSKRSKLHNRQTTIADFAFMADLNADIPPILYDVPEDTMLSGRNWNTFSELKTLLNDNGLDLIEEERKIKVFVMYDKK